jgi:hypothetical protein
MAQRTEKPEAHRDLFTFFFAPSVFVSLRHGAKCFLIRRPKLVFHDTLSARC